jgi:hypothetical protein
MLIKFYFIDFFDDFTQCVDSRASQPTMDEGFEVAYPISLSKEETDAEG